MNHVKKYKRVLVLLGTACVIYVSFCYILPLVVPFVLALIFAKMLQPWTKKIHTATHMNQKLCSILLVLVSLGAVGSFLFYIGYLCASQLVEFIRHLPGRAGALAHLCQGGCGSIDNLLALTKGTSYRWLEARLIDMDGQIAGVLLPQITGSLPRMFLRIGEWGAGFVVFLMATLLLAWDEKTEVRYPALVPYVKKLKIAGFAYLKAQGLLLFFIAVKKSVCCAARYPYCNRRRISNSWKWDDPDPVGGIFLVSKRLCDGGGAFDAVRSDGGRPGSAGTAPYGKRDGIEAAVCAFVCLRGSETVWSRRHRARPDRTYDIKNGI